MIDAYVTGLVVASLVLAVAGLISSAIDRPPGIWHLLLAAAIEVAVVVQLLIAGVGLIRGAVVSGLALFLAYLAFCVVVLPLGALYAVEEKTRWSGVVLAVAGLALVITLVRLNDIWVGPDA